MYSRIINPIFCWKKQILDREFAQFAERQEALLQSIIKQNQSVAYLKQKNISDIRTFQKYCPAVTYDEIEGEILAVKNQRINTLTADKIIAFAKSSGTTSRSKWIPMTRQSIDANYTAGKTMLSYYIAQFPNTKIFEGKNFSLTGSYDMVNGYVVGDVSALFTYYLSSIYKPFRIPNRDIATIKDWNEKLEKLLPILATADIRWIAGVPSWISVVIEKMETYCQQPIQCIWKNLEVYFYGGISIEPFRNFFEQKFDGKLRLWQTYNASEGFFGLQISQSNPHLRLLHHTGNYYEFIPIEYRNDPYPPILNLTSIEENKLYELLITNPSGLYRYRIGDVVQFLDKENLFFEIKGRTQNFINAFGEELMVSNTEKAISLLSQELKFRIKDYTVAPIITGHRGYHNWQIEFIEMPEDLVFFQKRLDEILRSLNSDYDAKRTNNFILDTLQIEVLENEIIDRWYEKNNRKNVQSKIPKLCQDNQLQLQLKALMTS